MIQNYRATVWASYFGYITQAIINNLAPLLFLIFQERFSLPLTQITLLITLNFTVQLCVDFLSARLIHRIGYRKGVVGAHLFAGAGLLGMAVLPVLLPSPFLGLLVSVFLYAVGGGLLEVLISPIVEACPTENKTSAMGLLHSFYCWGAAGVILLSTLFLLAFGRGSWQLLCLLWTAIPFGNALFFSLVPINTLSEDGEKTSFKSLLSNKAFILFFLLMFAAGASELAMSQWASAFAEKGLGVDKTLGDLLGPFSFALLMGISRVVYAKFSTQKNIPAFLIGCGGLCIASYLLTVVTDHPVLSLIGCALCGLSVGAFWPGVFSLAASAIPQGGIAMFALLSLAGDLGCSGGPSLVGFASDLFSDSLRVGLAFAVLFPVMIVAFTLLYRREKKRTLLKEVLPERN